MRIYTPYTPQQAICKDLGALAPDCLEKSPASVPESEFLLVFIGAGQPTRYEPHQRSKGHFLARTGVLTLQRGAAVLDVVPPETAHAGSAIYLQPRHQPPTQ